ncbi:MAG: peptide chain release factor 1 [Clostridia bacterium]|nr:peptide chain release factor 1 [Clostridia bacterium]
MAVANLQDIENRFEEIERRLCDPTVIADTARYQALLKESASLAPLVETVRALKAAAQTVEDATALLAEPDLDKEMKELAKEELHTAKEDVARLQQQLKILLLPKDPLDDRDIIVEIRAGAGGEESALFAGSLYRMYSMYAEKQGFSTEAVNINETALGGCKEVCFSVSGTGAYSRFKFESGVHRVQRVPETETGGRIHTSTVTVAVLPETDEVEVEIRPSDLQIDTFRASGAGGQHINKTDSAIRITHLPTGMVVECQDERSQFKNKDKAMRVLRARLFEQEQQKQHEATAADRKAQVGTGDRSERIRTYNFPQGRVTDHRIGLTLYRIDSILDGDLNEIIDALITADQTAKLQEAE